MLACARTEDPSAAGLSAVQQTLSATRAHEAAVQSALDADRGALTRIQGSAAQLSAKVSSIERDLAQRQAVLAALTARLRTERARLARLEVELRQTEQALGRNLVADYEADRPDLVTVVLDAHGFNDLLERMEFLRRAGHLDARLVGTDRAARSALSAQAARLGALQARQQRMAVAILRQRDQLVAVQLTLARRANVLTSAAAHKSTELASIRQRRQQLQQQFDALTAQAAAATVPAATITGAGGPRAILRGGGFVFPMPAGAAAPPGSWSPDQGVDIAAPGHTPLLAVASGTIVLHGIGGFGPSAPVLRLDDGRYVYYGHAGPGNMLPIGTHVSAGQVISEVGAGIVGISSGPHLEIGFCDSSGTPLGAQTAPEMLALLRAAYGG